MITRKLQSLKSIPREIRGVTELRRDPDEVFKTAEKKKSPVLITEFNNPKGVIIPLDIYDDVLKLMAAFEQKEARERALELIDALDSLAIYREEKKSGNLKELKSLRDLS